MHRRLAALTCAAALALTACSADAPDDVEIDGATVDGTDTSTENPTEGDAVEGEEGATDDEGQGAVPGAGPSPAPGECVTLEVPEDGIYTVADAGTATIGVEGDRLIVGGISPAAGWEHEVTDADGDDVEVEFRREGVELDLEVELEDGQVTAELCQDDD
ncbi:hypothetical protein J4G33_06685 [Actinotalea sp. BY-33]|uniref:Uncharacterized protein n=1 Tax=Actinotalea soli TaxID=2819234 RepID=A0A939LPU2_9CELL|nr:hypothetical protein [Actinotalea soli]MBO1751488.1 hypothetical protein [Actinotalea soli]